VATLPCRSVGTTVRRGLPPPHNSC
jgi:hypothetical protein